MALVMRRRNWVRNELGPVGIAAPSANRSGGVSPTEPAHVLSSLDGRIAGLLDGGRCATGLESTIVAATGGPLRLLRRGPIEVPGAIEAASDAIEATGQLIDMAATATPASSGEPPCTPCTTGGR